MSHVFLSYVREDQATVDALAKDLERRGALIWIDRESIDPGRNWRDAIRDAIGRGNFFVACFSTNAIQKPNSGMDEELDLAVFRLEKTGNDPVWFIPVLLDGCAVPRRPIGTRGTMADLQCIRLADGWDKGVSQIAAIALDLEKKHFKEAIDIKAKAVIDAERRLMNKKHQELERAYTDKTADSAQYINTLGAYEERLYFARDEHERLANSYVQRFDESYWPLSDLYFAFEAEKRTAEAAWTERQKQLGDWGTAYQFFGLLLFLVVMGIVALVNSCGR